MLDILLNVLKVYGVTYILLVFTIFTMVVVRYKLLYKRFLIIDIYLKSTYSKMLEHPIRLLIGALIPYVRWRLLVEVFTIALISDDIYRELIEIAKRKKVEVE